MNYIDFSNPAKVHFTGIGGISMSGFAELLLNKGFKVSGSDWKQSPVSARLEKLGAEIAYGPQKAENVPSDASLLVFTAAVKPDNPELVEAKRLGIPSIERGKLAGEVMLRYKNNFAVAGTHGKTTGTSMLSLIALAAGLDPTISVGSVLGAIGGNMRIGNDENFIIEACEYTDSFLNFHPTRAIITNVEAEHLDYFKTPERMRDSFRRFAELLPADGLLVLHSGIEGREELFASVKCPIVTYSEKADADYTAKDITFDDFGYASFTLVARGNELGRIKLSVPGIHNVANACGTAAMALESGIAFSSVQTGLESFRGAARRFEKKGEVNGFTVIDDYAHHPTEIKATLEGAKRYPHKVLWTVFQPHTYSRTAEFTEEIADALAVSDKVILTDIYAAREVNTFGISSEDIVKILRDKYGKEVYYFPSFKEIEAFLLENCSQGDVLITMGAGDVVNIAENLIGN